ncbi:MAG: hypothetical protein CVU06_09650 [Bacteroidetes bacterium HGW-Bacteroidetes-22]|nr:MAG: hypothetical protein CVU06_09650 [Bacteroidetes bacterium HGW-Bacteroidetes-22]
MVTCAVFLSKVNQKPETSYLRRVVLFLIKIENQDQAGRKWNNVVGTCSRSDDSRRHEIK